MQVEIKKPDTKKQYPYLAFWTGEVDPKPKQYALNDVVIISEVYKDGDIRPYVSFLNGSKEGYFTKNENEYTPLAKGTLITILQ